MKKQNPCFVRCQKCPTWTVGKAAAEFHTWDQQSYINEDQENKSEHEEEPTNDQEEDSESRESNTTNIKEEDTKEEDPIANNTNQEIRNAPVPLKAQTPWKSPLKLNPIAPLPPLVFQSVNLPSMVQMSPTQLAPAQVSTNQPARTSGSSG